jgi:hypothetical protein
MAKAPAVPKALQVATKGLSFPSETDAPVVPFAWPAGPATAAGVRAQAGEEKSAKVEELTLAELFRGVPRELRGRYHDLLVTLADVLKGVKVFKFGTTRVRVYVVGVTAEGTRAGVQTELVET